ncbi:hypothetical protein [Sorangium sp. So ce1151]|uniref:hypothetical protein n=1 Tax=Sorangium sp. So ce1151 TaxID=3133332 RepID=UPI003F62D839
MVRMLAPLVVAAFACQEVEQPLGDAPLTGEGGAATEDGGAAGSTGGTVGGAEDGGSSGELGDGGEPPNPDVRFVVVGPIDPASTTPRAGVKYSTDWIGADINGSVLAGFSASADTDSDFTTGVRFLWTPEAGTTRLPYSAPAVGMYAPSRLSGDGKSLFGEVMNIEAIPNGIQFGPVSFYRWTEETGDVPFGPSEPMWNGQIDFVSADGSAALGSVELQADVEAGDGHSRWFRWTESRGFELLTTLGWPARAGCSAVSEDFATMAGYGDDGKGFLWLAPDRVLPLTGIPEFPYCSASSISHDGSIAFGGCHDESSEGVTAFRWTEETGMVSLDVPSVVSATGDGRLAFGTDGEALYRWSATAGSTRLEPPVDWVMGRAYWLELVLGSLSDDGSTIYGQLSVTAGAALEPEQSSFRWSEADGFVRLDALPGHDESWIQGQSSDGSVQVGSSRLRRSASDAVLWDCGGVRDIGRELREGGAELSGVHLSWASQVWTGSTLMIAGSGEAGGNRVAWIAWLPARC